MANPNNALGTNGAYGGRTSVNAFNDVLGVFPARGILSGWECVPSSGLTVELGGDGSTRDVAIAEDNVGNKTTVNNISQAPISVEMPAAPANNSRVDSIVAYIESSPSTNAETDNYSAVNLLIVSGTAASSPTMPSESDIRTAITADGAAGSSAYYVVLANITIPAGTTDIDSSMITAGVSLAAATRQTTFPYDFQVILTRVGNMVFAQMPDQVNTTMPQSSEGEVGVFIPYGFRPTRTTTVALASIRGRVGNAGFDIYSTGNGKWFCEFNSTGAFRPALSAVWKTEDPFPTN